MCTTQPRVAYTTRGPCLSHRSLMCALLYTQERLTYESKFCPKEGCGSPMVPYVHLGKKKKRCSKKKCNHITREYVSEYYHQSGTLCTAIQ